MISQRIKIRKMGDRLGPKYAGVTGNFIPDRKWPKPLKWWLSVMLGARRWLSPNRRLEAQVMAPKTQAPVRLVT